VSAHAFVDVATLAVIGVGAGALGSLVGLGGAFVVIPILRMAYLLSPAATAGISLVMVAANAISGSATYLRQGRADVRAAALVSLTGIPASLLGAHLVRSVTPGTFDALYGALLVSFFAILVRHRRSDDVAFVLASGMRERVIIDRTGKTFRYATNLPLVLLAGVALGLVSSFFGVGGGMIFVSVFVGLFKMPPHVSTATSTLAIVLTAPAGIATHGFEHGIMWIYAAPLAVGGLIGGQIGPRLGRRLSARQLLDVLAATVLFAGLTLVLKHVPWR